MSKPIRILAADDHPMIREGIAAIIQTQADMDLVGEASNGVEAIEKFSQLRPDVTLMDLQMPDMTGIDVIKAIRLKYSEARILILTSYSGDTNAVRALKAGAYGYLLKSTLRRELLDAIRTVHGGRKRIPSDIAAEIAEHAGGDELSEREMEILGRLAAGGSNKQIAVRLGISEQTVKAHMKSILAKLGAQDRTQAVMLAIKRGIISV
ncbi:response regulator [Aquisalinus flavus]|uniref:DNA-binding response regulator n=1 Tax=Aquisalinus flavus TaxID=1526572 RepID=A0A8J2V359_9PROT|nr:response regulator transcription factor [Aquisalinus flavus]GGD11430.1 DNA-binding response regulator [Aquisalinus flavus]